LSAEVPALFEREQSVSEADWLRCLPGAVREHALALPAMEEIAEEVGEFQGDSAWRAQLERLRHAETVQPKLPSTLQAELRDYQRDGFEWLSRLAAWGDTVRWIDDSRRSALVACMKSLRNSSSAF